MTEPLQLKIIAPPSARSHLLMVEYARPAIAYMEGHLTRAEFVLLIDLVRLEKKART